MSHKNSYKPMIILILAILLLFCCVYVLLSLSPSRNVVYSHFVGEEVKYRLNDKYGIVIDKFPGDKPSYLVRFIDNAGRYYEIICIESELNKVN